MQHKIEILGDGKIVYMLNQTPKPPKQLFIRGTSPPESNKLVTIVGSRSCSQYGKEVVDEICKTLAGHPVSIISGLAIGIDGHAHQRALAHKLHTVAVVGSGLRDEVLYPRQHKQLAQQILDAGGALISENNPQDESKIWMFPARNRLMAGMSDLVIIIEAKEKSGTLITAGLALDYNRELMAVPNSIYSTHSKGSNELLRQGAHMYTKPDDVLHILGFKTTQTQTTISYDLTQDQKHIYEAIDCGHVTTQALIDYCSSSLSISTIIQTILTLEIEEKIKKIDGAYMIYRY